MKIKQNLFLKILAFLLALVFFGAAGAMAVYQVANFSVMWQGESCFYGYTCQLLYQQADRDIQKLVFLSEDQELDTYSRMRLEELESAYAAENTNLRWQVRIEDSVLHGNAAGALPEQTSFAVYTIRVNRGVGTESAELIMWLDPDLPLHDDYRIAVRSLEVWRAHRAEFLAATAVSALLGLLCTIYLCVTCGHKKGREGIYLNWFHHIPGDLLLAACVFGVILLIIGAVDALEWSYWPFRFGLALSTACMIGIALLTIGFLVSFVARCKGRTVLRYTVIGWLCGKLWKLCKWLWRVCRAAAAAIPLIWRILLAGIAYQILSLIFVYSGIYNMLPFWLFVWIMLTVAAIAYLCWWAYHWKKVRVGTHEIISGNTNYHIERYPMPLDLQAHADELNSLGHAIGAAVEERMRSEHFKTELITNVSHDLKTPLTSIISYVDLLKKEEIDNPKVQEYIEVLDRKSQRLKKLTEDLVEASKASTGALNVMRERLDLVQLTNQALGEYEERLNTHGLNVVRTLPTQPVWVVADGRHLWRILDNLLSNCVKYALEGTRVYVELQPSNDSVKLSVKNISRDELNVPARQLTERFVRGDESRTMEGSGLGLSIAQSLTELQQGQFEISVDGDLFKATVTLPLAPATEFSVL